MLYKHGLAVMRAQPFHLGHKNIINKMLNECENVTIVLGSVQNCGTERNPFTFDMRRKMIENCCTCERINILGVEDINRPDIWAEFVLEQVKNNAPHLPVPDVYYAGCREDGAWFDGKIETIVIVDRYAESFPIISATMVRDMLRSGDERWKDLVPHENIDLIFKNFQEIFHG